MTIGAAFEGAGRARKAGGVPGVPEALVAGSSVGAALKVGCGSGPLGVAMSAGLAASDLACALTAGGGAVGSGDGSDDFDACAAFAKTSLSGGVCGGVTGSFTMCSAAAALLMVARSGVLYQARKWSGRLRSQTGNCSYPPPCRVWIST